MDAKPFALVSKAAADLAEFNQKVKSSALQEIIVLVLACSIYNSKI
jgi:hypothetical protein